MLRFCSYIFCIALALLPIKAHAFTDDDSILIATFLYNLIDYINWNDKDHIRICSYGRDEVSHSLVALNTSRIEESTELDRNRRVSVVESIAKNDISHMCNILYFTRFESNRVLETQEIIKDEPILTVSGINNFVDLGGIMEFRITRRKLKLRLGKEALKKSTLSLSPVILMSIKPEDKK